MWILFTVWFLAIALLAVIVLRMARNESHFGTFSSWFPDGDGKDSPVRKPEQKRARVVAAGIQYAPQSGIAPGATAGADTGEKAKIATKSSVVEVRAVRQSKPAEPAARIDAHGLPQASRVAAAGIGKKGNKAAGVNKAAAVARPMRPKKQSASEREVASPLLAGLVEETEAKKASEEEN